MLGSGFRFYVAYTTPKIPLTVDSLIVNALGGAPVGPGAETIVTLEAANSLKLADQLKDVTEAGSPNTINTTTRATGRLGTQSSEITTTSRDLTCQFVYSPAEAFETPVAGYEVLDLFEYCDATSQKVFIIDLDNVLAVDGAKGSGANYSIALSQPREVEGQVVYDVTCAVRDFWQRVQHDGTTFRGQDTTITP